MKRNIKHKKHYEKKFKYNSINKKKVTKYSKYFILIILAAYILFFLYGSDSINDILNNPTKYENKKVYVFGTIKVEHKNDFSTKQYITDKNNNSLKIIPFKNVNIDRLKDGAFEGLEGNISIINGETTLIVKEIQDNTSLLFKIKEYIYTLGIWSLLIFVLFSYILLEFRSIKFKLFRTFGRFDFFSFVCALSMIFVLFQPAFGFYIGDFSSSAGGISQIEVVKKIINTPLEKTLENSYEGISGSYILFMMIALLSSITFFLLSSIGIGNKTTGAIGAISALIYAGINYTIVTQLNSQLGIFQGLGGISMGSAGIISVIVGGGYLYLKKV